VEILRKSAFFEGRWVTLGANIRRKGASPPTTVGVRKLEWLPICVISKYPPCAVWFCHKARMWQTDGQNYDSRNHTSIAASCGKKYLYMKICISITWYVITFWESVAIHWWTELLVGWMTVAVTDGGRCPSDGKRAWTTEAIRWSTTAERWYFWTTESITSQHTRHNISRCRVIWNADTVNIATVWTNVRGWFD